MISNLAAVIKLEREPATVSEHMGIAAANISTTSATLNGYRHG